MSVFLFGVLVQLLEYWSPKPRIRVQVPYTSPIVQALKT